MENKTKIIIEIIFGLIFVALFYFALVYQFPISEKKQVKINEFTNLCERNNGTFKDSMNSCYIVEGDIVTIYKFTRNPDGEVLKLFKFNN